MIFQDGLTTEKASIQPLVNSRSIAVLLFTDMSKTRDQAYFCAGVSEEIQKSPG
jgi:TolB-like protein